MSEDTFQSKEFKENLQKYEAALAKGSSVYLEPDEFTDIAEYYHMHGQLAKALDAIDTAIEIFPGATEPLAFRARVAILLGYDAKEAMSYVNKIENKNDLDYYYIVAEIMIADNNVEKAEQYLIDKETVIDPDDLEDYYLDVATLFADYDVFDDAERWLSLCKDTDDNDYQELKGRIAISKGHYKESESIFNKLIDSNPYHTAYWDMLSSAQYLNNEISKSIESCDFALAIDQDDTDALLNKANGLTIIGNYDDAMKLYQHYKQLQPHSEAADMGMGAILMAEEKFDESLEHWHTAENLCTAYSSNKFDIYRNECFVYALMGNFDKAFEYVTKVETLSGGPTIDTYVLRGYLSLLAKNDDKARLYFEQALSLANPEDRDNTLWYIAYCYFDCNYMQEAHDLLRKLTKSKKSKSFVDIWAYLVRTDYELGLQEEFLDDLKKATERNPYGIQRELSDFFPKGMAVRDFYNYAIHHPINRKSKQ